MTKRQLLSLFIVFSLTATICFADSGDFLDGYYGNPTSYANFSFTDISETPWAAEAVEYLAKYKIVSGSDGLFYPNRSITRAEFVKILVLAFGLYDRKAVCLFYDVPRESWQYPYIASAKNLGITSGITDTEFGPDLPITREQMVTLAHKATFLDKDSQTHFTDGSDLISFADESEISAYASEAANTFLRLGIIKGDENGMFNPKNNATRAEACKMIYSIITKITIADLNDLP